MFGRIWIGFHLLFLPVVFTHLGQAGQIQIRVHDFDSGQPLSARAYLRCDGKVFQPPGLPGYRRGMEEHFLLRSEALLELEAKKCELVVARGLEYFPAQITLDGTEDRTVLIRLKRWAAMNRAGWYSADMHVHRDPKELEQILMAEDLNFAPTITYHVWSEQVSEPFPGNPTFPVIVDDHHLYTANSQEVERIQGGPGAVILLAKQLPIPFEGDEFYPPAVRFTRATHAQGGYVEGDKLFWLDTLVNVALGEIDFIELNCNHFLPHDVDTDLIPWSHWPVEMGYHGDRNFALWMMDFYYQILNSGFRLPLSAGSASGVKATPVGYNRVYVYLGDQSLTYDNLLRGMKEGRSFSTNGPLVDLKINGKVGPGANLSVQTGEEVLVEAVVRSRKELEQVDLILNGRVHRSYDGLGGSEVQLRESVTPGSSSWVALRAFERSDETIVFAHTSPAYLLIGDQPVNRPEDAAALLKKMDQLIDYTETKASFRRPEHREETLSLYRSARTVFEERARRNDRP